MPADNPDANWTMPSELEQPVPRAVRLSGLGITNYVMALAALLFGVGMSFRVVHDELHRQAENESLMRRVAAEGVETQATVTKLFTGLGYVVNYDYNVAGRRYSRGAFITQEQWQALQVRDPLAIRYLPSDPAQAYPDADPPILEKHWDTSLPLAGLILFFMGSFAAIFASRVGPERRLLSRGRTAPGVVTDCKEGSQGRSSGYFVSYEFTLAEGGRQQGKRFVSQPATPGSTVTVLYEPARPRRNGLYPLSMVKPASR
jgi:Protein of unknown function (DUF3592)